MFAATAVLAVLWGAAAGAVAWAIRLPLGWTAPLAAGGHLAQATLFDDMPLWAAAVIGLSLLVLTC